METGLKEQRATAQLYRILGEGLFGAFDHTLLERFWVLPELRGLLRQQFPELLSVESLNSTASLPAHMAQQMADELGAQHYALFARDIFPYASVYCEPEAILGGDVTHAYLDEYRHFGFTPKELDQESADHLALQLLYLSYLHTALVEAQTHGDNESASSIQTVMWHFLRKKVCSWVPTFVGAVRQASAGFFVTLVDLAFELLMAEQRRLADAQAQPISNGLTSDEVGLCQDLARVGALDLTDTHTSLRDIAHYFLCPARSGVFLSLSSIKAIAREMHLPSGFGAREDCFLTLWRGANDYDRGREFLLLLETRVRSLRTSTANLYQAVLPPSPFAELWAGRSRATEDLLSKLNVALPVDIAVDPNRLVAPTHYRG